VVEIPVGSVRAISGTGVSSSEVGIDISIGLPSLLATCMGEYYACNAVGRWNKREVNLTIPPSSPHDNVVQVEENIDETTAMIGTEQLLRMRAKRRSLKPVK